MWLECDGVRTFVATGGAGVDPALPAVLLVHGAGSDHSAWGLQSRGLARRGRGVLAPDLPGHGRSDGVAADTIPALADHLVRLLDAAGVDRTAVAGHSMGALAALDLAARHPDRVRALVLLGVAATMPVHPDLLAAARDDRLMAAAMIALWGHAGGGGDGPPGLCPAGMTRTLIGQSRPGALAAGLTACAAYDASAAAGRVTAPTTLILGGSDKMSPPRAGMALGGLIAGATVHVLDGAGHMLMAERPDLVLELLLRSV